MLTLGLAIGVNSTISPTEQPRARYRAVVGDYFQTLGIASRRGRLFDGFDGRENGPTVAIVNESVVRRYFANVDPIGQLMKIPMAGDLHIVGVVADIKHDGLQGNAQAGVFVPYFQFPLSEMQIVLATEAETTGLIVGLKPEMSSLDPQLPIVRVSRIEDLVSPSIAQPRFNMTLLVALALCAALLAAVGVYGVVTYAVARRTAEIRGRLALGADADRTFRLVVGGAPKVVLVGVVPGPCRRCRRWTIAPGPALRRAAPGRPHLRGQRRGDYRGRRHRRERAGAARVTHRPDRRSQNGVSL